MAKTKPTSVADITEILHSKFKDEVLAVPGETTLDTVKRILSAIVPDDDGLRPVVSEGTALEKRGHIIGTALNSAKKGGTVTVDLGTGVDHFILPPDKLLVDRKLFFELFSAMVRGQYIRYLNVAGMTRIAKIMGAKDREGEKKAYAECEKYLRDHKH